MRATLLSHRGEVRCAGKGNISTLLSGSPVRGGEIDSYLINYRQKSIQASLLDTKHTYQYVCIQQYTMHNNYCNYLNPETDTYLGFVYLLTLGDRYKQWEVRFHTKKYTVNVTRLWYFPRISVSIMMQNYAKIMNHTLKSSLK